MLQKHAPTTRGSSFAPSVPSAGIQIRPIPGTLRSGGSLPSADVTVASAPLVSGIRKTHSLRETIAKKVGTFLEAHLDLQKEEGGKHLSEPALHPLITAALLQRLDEPVVAPTLTNEPESTSSLDIDNLSYLIKNAVTCPIHKSSLLALRGEAAADTLLLMQQMLDEPVAHGIEPCRYTIRRLLIKLSREARILPSSLFLSGVVCRVRESFNGGAFADIYRASLAGKPVALKRLRVFRVVVDKQSRELNAAFFREALMWRQLRHPHILPFLGIDRDSFRPYLCMVSPYMVNGNIMQCIQHLDRTEADIPREPWLLEIAKGLEYLHQEQVVHGDLRGVNILIDEGLHVRLSDFGLSTLVDSNPLSGIPSNNGGAGRWSAPEIFHGCQPSVKSDVYSFACVCIEIYTRSPPFSHLNEMQAMVRVMDGERPTKPSPHTGIHQYMLNLLDRCLEGQPGSRPDATSLVRILSHCGLPTTRANAQHKPLRMEPTDTNADPEPVAKPSIPIHIERTTKLRSRSTSPSGLQYLNVSQTSPRSFSSFVMVPSTPSSHSYESHILVSNSPTHSHESHVVVSPFSPASSVMQPRSPHPVLSDTSSGYEMMSDSS